MLADQATAVKSFEVLPLEKVADAQAGAGGFGGVPESEREANSDADSEQRAQLKIQNVHVSIQFWENAQKENSGQI